MNDNLWKGLMFDLRWTIRARLYLQIENHLNGGIRMPLSAPLQLQLYNQFFMSLRKDLE